jgi:hypothetical protein
VPGRRGVFLLLKSLEDGWFESMMSRDLMVENNGLV